MSESKCIETGGLGAPLELRMLKKVYAVAAQSTFPSVLEADSLGRLLDVQMSFHMAGARDSAPSQSE